MFWYCVAGSYVEDGLGIWQDPTSEKREGIIANCATYIPESDQSESSLHALHDDALEMLQSFQEDAFQAGEEFADETE